MKNKKSQTIKSVEIKNLFEIFNYNIKYPKDENVLIITGPNGFGKTQVLNILFNLFNRRFFFFQNLVFDEIMVNLSGNISIKILKEISAKGISTRLDIIFEKGGENIETYTYNSEKENSRLEYELDEFISVSRMSRNRWMNHETGQNYSLEETVNEFSDQIPNRVFKSLYKIKKELTNKILDSIDVHLIREQRLFQKVNRDNNRHYPRHERDQNIMTETIQTYSNDLKEIINEKIQESYTKSQTLDSSYLRRLINEKREILKEEYDDRFTRITEKQERLIEIGLYESKQEVLNYSKDDSKALLVYLNDSENKLKVFDDLLEKLELFTNVLNERRFTFKSIHIDREKGFYFKTKKGKNLKLNQLSSGEQHEVVLLYELIFKTKPGILVLIDEPEISLHITWQKEFLSDLLSVIKIQGFQVLIATHSPSIINDRWDLVYNLEHKIK